MLQAATATRTSPNNATEFFTQLSLFPTTIGDETLLTNLLTHNANTGWNGAARQLRIGPGVPDGMV